MKTNQTEIYAHEKLIYPNGFTVTIDPPALIWKKEKENHFAFDPLVI